MLKWGVAALAVLASVFVGLASWDGLLAEGSVADPYVVHQVRIERDGYGVPHIFGKSDADVSYGLAMAHAEDDFANIEEVVAAVRVRAGAITGEAGAQLDFARGLLQPEVDAARAAIQAYQIAMNNSTPANALIGGIKKKFRKKTKKIIKRKKYRKSRK